jgi:putative addiction module component (TIGR02574 family)
LPNEIADTIGMSKPAVDIERLSPAERLDLIERLWDSLSEDDVPVTDAQHRELERRLDALDPMST